MLNVGVIGIGNCGSQVAELAKNKLAIDAVAMNTSEMDLSMVSDKLTKILIGDGRGAAKNRDVAKSALKSKIQEIIKREGFEEFIDKDVVFIVSSTGGGSGSGIAPIFSRVIKDAYPNTVIIPIGVLTKFNEAYSNQANTLDYLREMYKNLSDMPYMLYDNNAAGNVPTQQMMSIINNTIVDDIEVLSGKFNLPTRFNAIDEKELINLLSLSGRIAVSSVRCITEKNLDNKTIEELLIDSIQKMNHVSLEGDKKIKRLGLITNLNHKMSETIDISRLYKLNDLIGEPIEIYNHETVHEDKIYDNNIFVIMSGLSKIKNHIGNIEDRLSELEEAINTQEEDIEIKTRNLINSDSKKNSDPINIDELFSNF